MLGSGPDELALTARQLAAIDAWHRARRGADRTAGSGAASREVRMDRDRQRDVLHVQHEAIVARTSRALEASVRGAGRRVALRAVVGQRNAWVADRLVSALHTRGVEVIGRYENGAELVGVCVAEQPDLVVVEESLAMVPGDAVVRDVRGFAPHALVAAQVVSEERRALLLAAGAARVYLRGAPPDDVAADLLACLREQPAPV